MARDLYLNIPLLSAMDTVTESSTTLLLEKAALESSISLNPLEQAREVSKVKRAMTGVVDDPITMSPNQRLEEARRTMRENRISGVPVVDEHKLVGILTDRDLRFERNLERTISEVMTPQEQLVTCRPGVALDDAKALMASHKIEKLLVTTENGSLAGLITFKDVQAASRLPNATRDARVNYVWVQRSVLAQIAWKERPCWWRLVSIFWRSIRRMVIRRCSRCHPCCGKIP